MADRRRPRILVASGPVRDLAPTATAVALARGFAPRADVAVIGLAASGRPLAAVLAGDHGEVEEVGSGWVVRTDAVLAVGLRPAEVDGPPLSGSSAELGRLLAYAVSRPGPESVVVDLTCGTAHDAGAGLLGALGATADADLNAGPEPLADLGRVELAPVRELLAGRRLTGVVPDGEQADQMLGLRGITSRRGRAVQLPAERMLRIDAAIERFATLAAADQARADGAGAAGGLGFAVLALAGRLTTGPALTAEAARLDRALAGADLVVTAGDSFDFGSRGGAVVAELARRCEAAEVPLVVIAAVVGMSGREMRVMGVESAHPLEPGADPEAALTATARRLVEGWTVRW